LVLRRTNKIKKFHLTCNSFAIVNAPTMVTNSNNNKREQDIFFTFNNIKGVRSSNLTEMIFQSEKPFFCIFHEKIYSFFGAIKRFIKILILKTCLL
jgi:hypothetical protein